ncbi:type II toxin-antitoxin system RelE/ParE family toxin [Alkalihalobacillus sp. TS-13]|uniref:type II toxin-antitoxin system RelE family toxin n=1 Tax=Alkalihalobacillus sp. TS-13 TaxID=2842455 RepID=UPI001C88683B|nr:hypothetical protein [Alkalihalobacillus sp. TS-13]
MYNVRLASKRVNKEMKKLSNQETELLSKAINTLKKEPRPTEYDFGSLNLDKNIKRIKCKRVRLFYTIDEKAKEILIGKVENRDSHSYSMNIKNCFNAA